MTLRLGDPFHVPDETEVIEPEGRIVDLEYMYPAELLFQLNEGNSGGDFLYNDGHTICMNQKDKPRGIQWCRVTFEHDGRTFGKQAGPLELGCKNCATYEHCYDVARSVMDITVSKGSH